MTMNAEEVIEEDPDADTKPSAGSSSETSPPAASGQDVVEEDPEADTKPSGSATDPPADSSDDIVEEDPEADTKPSVSSTVAEEGIVEEDPDADTGRARAASGHGTGQDTHPAVNGHGFKLGVTEPGSLGDNSVVITVEEADPNAETRIKEVVGRAVGQANPTPSVGETGVHRLVITYSAHAPERLKHFYPKDKMCGDGMMMFGRLAPKGGVHVKLNDLTISKRQFLVTLVHKTGECYFEVKNMSSSKTILWNGDTLGLNEDRRLPPISSLRILDLDPKYGQGQSLDLILYSQTSRNSNSYQFEVTFICDPNWEYNFARVVPRQAGPFRPPPGVPMGDAPPAAARSPPISASGSFGYPLVGAGLLGIGSSLPSDLIGLVPRPTGLHPNMPNGDAQRDPNTGLPVQCSLSPNVSPLAPRKVLGDDAFRP